MDSLEILSLPLRTGSVVGYHFRGRQQAHAAEHELPGIVLSRGNLEPIPHQNVIYSHGQTRKSADADQATRAWRRGRAATKASYHAQHEPHHLPMLPFQASPPFYHSLIWLQLVYILTPGGGGAASENTRKKMASRSKGCGKDKCGICKRYRINEGEEEETRRKD